ncbi:hypothetical protein PIB30_069128 [Stylosanthes scabra]|uniref:Uncharacterized protein n=1 Tax=Stylosanthes scabra TaxID=79078 RepID=A0ABU6RNA0_9FABA|nr:hypothetical protein [Stylosanthes scabra]
MPRFAGVGDNITDGLAVGNNKNRLQKCVVPSSSPLLRSSSFFPLSLSRKPPSPPLPASFSPTSDLHSQFRLRHCVRAHNARQVYYLQYPGSGRSNWRVIIKCKPRGRIEAEAVLVQEEAYQNTEEISVRLINETEIPQTLTSLDGEVDIVNTQPPHTESDDEGAVDEGSSEDNEAASAESISTEDDE